MRTMRWLAVALIGAGLITACKDRRAPINPVARATWRRTQSSPSTAPPCAAISTIASSDDVGIAGWSWALATAAESNEQSPVHKYGSAGPYTVSLTVTDEEGETSIQTKQVLATDPAGDLAHLRECLGSGRLRPSALSGWRKRPASRWC